MPSASSAAVASEAGVAASPGEAPDAHIVVRDMVMAYGSFVLIRDLNFTIRRGDIFVIMGGSGCGKSTLMRQLIGLKEPARGKVYFAGKSFWDTTPEERELIMRRFGVLYQSGALWSSMTLAENVGLPLGEFTDLSPGEIREVARLKLALVGLAGFEDYYPSEVSGGMRKRAGLAGPWRWIPRCCSSTSPRPGSIRSAPATWTI